MKTTTLQKAVLTLAALTIPLALTAQAGSGGSHSVTARGTQSQAGTQKSQQAPPGSIWYNGDFDGVNGLANSGDSSFNSQIYDDFTVPSASTITAVFSDDLSTDNITGASYEIRTGITEGNGGTLIYSGMTSSPTVTPTGRSGFGFTEYMVQVDTSGDNINLSPGTTYWLNVTPIGDGSGVSYDSTTSGQDAVGMPQGNDGMAYINSSTFGADFELTTDFTGDPTQHDYSMGVIGNGGGGGGITLTSTASRKTDGGYGKFDVTLPGIEDRKAPANIVFNFSGPVMSADSASSTCGNVTSIKVKGSSVVVALDNHGCDQETVTVTLTGIHDTMGNTDPSETAKVTFLLGDVDGNGTVDTNDENLVKMNFRKPVTNSNFRTDVLANGQINKLDERTVRQNLGHSAGTN